jgi:hypothetical protein
MLTAHPSTITAAISVIALTRRQTGMRARIGTNLSPAVSQA